MILRMAGSKFRMRSIFAYPLASHHPVLECSLVLRSVGFCNAVTIDGQIPESNE